MEKDKNIKNNWLKPMIIIGLLGLALSFTSYIFPISSELSNPNTLTTVNSPGSIITQNQTGGKNTIINNKVPKPKLTITFVSINIPTNDGKFRTEFYASIASISNIPSGMYINLELPSSFSSGICTSTPWQASRWATFTYFSDFNCVTTRQISSNTSEFNVGDIPNL